MTPSQDLVLSLHQMMTHLMKRIDRPLSAHGISFSEFLVLFQLSQAPNQTLRRLDLAEAIGMSASGVTRLLNPMEKNRLVQKESNPRDARVSLVQLSEAGQRIYQETLATFEHAASDFFKPLKEEQIQRMLGLSQALL
ncbi:MAG: MarR family transcriptional regulator [bacterium]|nr:MarR family transcriptional regulator [bacterium]